MSLPAIMKSMRAPLAPCAISAIAISTLRKTPSDIRGRLCININIAELDLDSKFSGASCGTPSHPRIDIMIPGYWPVSRCWSQNVLLSTARGVRPPMTRSRRAAGAALETLAEDGNPKPPIAVLSQQAGVKQSGLFLPGQPVTITADPEDRIAFASMFVQIQCSLLATGPEGIALFDAEGIPTRGELTSEVTLWDAGTEQNEAPGIGANQAPRQPRPNTAPSEGGAVGQVHDGFSYPAVSQVIKIEIE